MSNTADADADGELSSAALSPPTRWLLLDGGRHHVAAAILLAVTVLLGGLLASGVGSVQNQNSLTRLFSALVGGNLTLITVAITINQLILSREFATPDELRDRIDEMLQYRREVEQTADAAVSPVTPDGFLEFLAREISHHAEQLRAATADEPDEPAPGAVEDYVGTLITQADRVDRELDHPHGDQFDTLLTILDTDFTSDLLEAERLRKTQGDELGDRAVDVLGEVVDLLEYMGVGRQYFKALYMQRELADLSRQLLAVGIPAVASSILAVWLYGHPDGARLEGTALAVVVLLAAVVALAPLAVLVAYVLRITTITRQTASLMPFTIGEDSPL